MSVAATVNAATPAVLPAPGAPGWNPVTATTAYTANVNYTFPGAPVNTDTLYVHVWFKDAAGNVSAVVSDSVTYGVTNRAPIANAGVAQDFTLPGPVTLNGFDSKDPDGDPLTYRWSFVSIPPGSKATIPNPTSMTTTFNTDVTGSYVAALVVNDGKVDSAAA